MKFTTPLSLTIIALALVGCSSAGTPQGASGTTASIDNTIDTTINASAVPQQQVKAPVERHEVAPAIDAVPSKPLGMTKVELQQKISAGQTIQDIAKQRQKK